MQKTQRSHTTPWIPYITLKLGSLEWTKRKWLKTNWMNNAQKSQRGHFILLCWLPDVIFQLILVNSLVTLNTTSQALFRTIVQMHARTFWCFIVTIFRRLGRLVLAPTAILFCKLRMLDPDCQEDSTLSELNKHMTIEGLSCCLKSNDIPDSFCQIFASPLVKFAFPFNTAFFWGTLHWYELSS